MKFNSINGKTEFLMRTGNGYVKNTMSAVEAKNIINNGEVTESNAIPGFPICVDDTYFFPGVEDKRKYTKRTIEPEQETDTKEDE